jgi:hypothetical protein
VWLKIILPFLSKHHLLPVSATLVAVTAQVVAHPSVIFCSLFPMTGQTPHVSLESLCCWHCVSSCAVSFCLVEDSFCDDKLGPLHMSLKQASKFCCGFCYCQKSVGPLCTYRYIRDNIAVLQPRCCRQHPGVEPQIKCP